MKKVVEFFKRRPSLRRDNIISEKEYEQLKTVGTLGEPRDTYLRGYSDGWKDAK